MLAHALALSLLMSLSSPAAAAEKSLDAVVVLGAGDSVEGWANPVLVQRVCKGVLELRAGRAKKLLMTGGRTNGHIAESEMMLLAAVAMGAPREDVSAEAYSVDTIENAAYSTELAKQRRWRRIGLVSNGLHLARAKIDFEAAGGKFYEEVETFPSDKTDARECEGPQPQAASSPYDLAVIDVTREVPLGTPDDGWLSLAESARRAAVLYRSGAARRIYFAIPDPGRAQPGYTKGSARGPFSRTEAARIMAAALGVPFDLIVISSGRRNGGIPGAVEPVEDPWLRVPDARVLIVAPEERRDWWRRRFKTGYNAALEPPQFMEP